MGDVLLDDSYKDKIEIIPVATIGEVFEHAMGSVGGQKPKLIEKLKQFASEKKIGISLPEPIAPPLPSRSL
jgi:Lon-like ATP-dependent protease